MRGSVTGKRSSSLRVATSTKHTHGRSSLPTGPPPFVIARVSPSSISRASCGAFPYVGNVSTTSKLAGSRTEIAPSPEARSLSTANSASASRENVP